jgi:hypothetical protein
MIASKTITALVIVYVPSHQGYYVLSYMNLSNLSYLIALLIAFLIPCSEGDSPSDCLSHK